MMESLNGALTYSEDSVWLEDITFNVDTCNSGVKEYLESRKDDPLSENRSTMSRLQCF